VQILVAEDNPGDVRLIREALKQHDLQFSLHVVEDGEKALAFIDRLESRTDGPVDLIMLDLNLPKSDGRDILRRIQSSPMVHHTPVLVLSSSDSPRDRDDSVRLGARQYIRKPATLDEFMEIGAIVKSLVLPT
jgi:CheY-like chemotaxis protein